MQTIADRLGFDLVSLRLELFGRRREPVADPRKRDTSHQRISRRSAGASGESDPALEQGSAAR